MIAFTTYATSWPVTIISSFWFTSRPRRSTGAISLMYTGTVADTHPAAKPSTTRAVTSRTAVGARADPSVPKMKITAAPRITARRSSLSAILPPNVWPRRRLREATS